MASLWQGYYRFYIFCSTCASLNFKYLYAYIHHFINKMYRFQVFGRHYILLLISSSDPVSLSVTVYPRLNLHTFTSVCRSIIFVQTQVAFPDTAMHNAPWQNISILISCPCLPTIFSRTIASCMAFT